MSMNKNWPIGKRMKFDIFKFHFHPSQHLSKYSSSNFLPPPDARHNKPKSPDRIILFPLQVKVQKAILHLDLVKV